MITDIGELVPGGILQTDYLHIGTNDRTCSRCRNEVPDDQVPLMLWLNDNQDMLIYCETCLGCERDPAEHDYDG